MSEHLLKLSIVAKHNTSFVLDLVDLKIRCNKKYLSDYLRIKDLINITDELNQQGISYIVYDEYIDIA